ncbi:MAG: radical SAM protein [Thermoplasmata archaeon]|nr:radical SAM protein [Thermoplasmata archaeon]
MSKTLKVCVECVKNTPDKAKQYIFEAHRRSRDKFSLPLEPPRASEGAQCKLCVNSCQIPEGEKGYCGLRTNEAGKLVHLGGTSSKGIVEWYYDSLPTNCVAAEVCPGCTGAGYPKYSYSDGSAEHGYKNLAVFYGACTFNCLFCQNWQYRRMVTKLSPMMTAQELSATVDPKTSCICYFGGDPTPQILHAIKTSKLALEANSDRILRICWESNGSMSRSHLKTAADLSMSSGGCLKFDLKTWNEELHKALCGVTNKRTLENFEWLVDKYFHQRKSSEPPFLTASTLLVPGYIEHDEVAQLAEFLSSLDPNIPYSLLAFHPQFYMEDMPVTTRKQADECYEAAKKAGLVNVRVGNLHLLSD